MSNPPDKEIETYKKAGWLIKRGGTRGEKHGTKRWFVLKAQNLFYYVKEKDYPHQPKGGVDLHEAILIEQSFTKCEHGFQIVEVSGDEGRTYYLEPANQKDKEDWCEVIRQELPQSKKKKKAGGGDEGASTYRYRNIHCGYLTKRPSKDKGRGAWQRRFFVLQPDALLYYQQPSDHLPPEKPKGSISLKDVTITMDSAEKHPYAFQINCKDDGKGQEGRKYFLEPDPASQAFRDEWLAAITIVLTNPEEAKLLAVTPSRQSRMSMGLSRPNSPTTPISPKGFKLTTSPGTSPVTSAPSSPRDYKKSEPGFSPRSESKDGDTPKSSTPIFVPPFLRTGPSASNLLNNPSPSQSREVSSSDTSSGPPTVTRALSSPGPSPPPTTRTIATGTTPSSSSMIALSTTDQNSPLGVQSLFRPASAKGTGGGIGGRPAPITTTPIGGGESPGPASPTTEEPLSPSTPSSRFGSSTSSGQQTPSSSRPSSAQHSRTSSVNRSRPPSFSSSNIPVIQEEGSEGRGNSASTFQVGENLSSSFIVRKTGGDLPIVPESSSLVVEVLPNRTSPESSISTTGQRPRGGSMDPSGGPSTPSKLNTSSEPPSPGGSNDSTHTRTQSNSLAAKMAAMGAVSLSGPLTPTKLPPPSPARKIVFPPIPVANPRKTVGQGALSPYGAPPPPPPLSHDAIASLAFLPPRTPSSGENNIPRSSSNQDLSQCLPPRSSSPQPPRPSTPQSLPSSSASMIQESPSKKTNNPSLTLIMPQNTSQIVPPGPPPTPDSRLESPFSVHASSAIIPPGPPPTPPSGPSRDPFPPTGSEILPPSGPPPTSTSHRVIQMAPSDALPPSGTPPGSKKGSISGDGPHSPDAYSTPVKKSDSKTTTTPASNVYYIAYSEESQMLGAGSGSSGSSGSGGQAPVTPRQNRLQQQQLLIQQQLQQEG